MGRSTLRNAWSEVHDQISEWWEDLSENDPASIDGPQNHHSYPRSLAFLKVKVRMTGIRRRGSGSKVRGTAEFRVSQYGSRNLDDL